MSERHDRLARRHHLSRLGQGRGDDAIGVGDERRVGERILLQRHGPFGLNEGAARLIGGRARLVEIGGRRPSPVAKLRGALALGDRLIARGASSGKRGLGLLELQLPIRLVEGGERLAGLHLGAAIDEPLGDLARHAKAEIALDAGLDHADQVSGRDGGGEMGRHHEDGALGLRRGLRHRLAAAGERERCGEHADPKDEGASE